MITTFNAMPSSDSRRRSRLPIIAALLVVAMALGACGIAVRLGYNQGPSLAFRWLDSYAELNDAQSLRVRTGLDEWFAWHRRTQLPDYAELLARARAEVAEPVTTERMCAWGREIRARIEAGLEHAAPVLAEVAPTLSLQQIASIEKRYVEKNGEYRDDFLDRVPAKRKKAAVRREVERAELLYGGLDDAQREFVAAAVARSPWDGDLAYAERLHRQRDLLNVLRRLSTGRAGPSQADAEIRAYVQRVEHSPREEYRRYAERVADFNCEFAAALHNRTSGEQRRVAARRLKGYEDELRALAADAS
jgi:hypothetical protein